MQKKYAVLSDIHGNLSALEAVMDKINNESGIAGIILLGDIIDYGMRSNEVITYLKSIKSPPVIINIWGNHEKIIMDNDFNRLSTDRGRQCADYTRKHLTNYSIEYLENLSQMGMQVFDLNGYRCLAVHGSLNHTFWGSISTDILNGDYKNYDIVFSGHSHVPHTFQRFYDTDYDELRNKKAVLFINPGSVGQPRNHNSKSQFAILNLDSLSVTLNAVPYNIKLEQSLYPKEIDKFYSERLERGI